MATAVLVGGAGFVGTHLTQYLSQRCGYRVVVADLVEPHSLPSSCSFVRADVRERLEPSLFPSHVDLLVNLAAVHREPGHLPHEYYDTNVAGAREINALCDARGFSDVVFVSSISVYGPTEEPLSDDAVPAPVTDYGRSKYQAEQLHREWQLQDPHGRRLTIVRPAVIYGRGEGGNFSRLGEAIRRHRFVYPGRRDTVKANGYVVDLARSIEFMHRHNAGELTYNFASPRSHTLEEICTAFSTVAGIRPPRWTIPLRPMLLAGDVGDRSGVLGRRLGLSRRRIEKLFFSTNIKADRLIEMGFEFEYDLESALRHWYEQEPVGRFV